MLNPCKLHVTKQCFTDGIELAILAQRQSLKSLASRTLAFTRKQDMLEASLRLCVFDSLQIKIENNSEIFKLLSKWRIDILLQPCFTMYYSFTDK